MSVSKWSESDISKTFIDYTSATGNSINGYFRYYTDNSLCIYTCFDISETTISKSANQVYVTYDFHFEGETLSVTVDKNGITSGTNELGKSVFYAQSNFDTYGTYISAVQYIGKEYTSCYIDVTLYVNGHNYKFTKNRKLYGSQLYMELPTTTTTAKATTLKTATQKARKTTAAKSKNANSKKKAAAKTKSKTKSNKSSTTKFKPKYNITTTAANNKNTPAKNAVNEAQAQADVQQNNGSPSKEINVNESYTEGSKSQGINPAVKQYLPLLIIIMIIGLALLIAGAVKSNKRSDSESKGDDEPKEDY